MYEEILVEYNDYYNMTKHSHDLCIGKISALKIKAIFCLKELSLCSDLDDVEMYLKGLDSIYLELKLMTCSHKSPNSMNNVVNTPALSYHLDKLVGYCNKMRRNITKSSTDFIDDLSYVNTSAIRRRIKNKGYDDALPVIKKSAMDALKRLDK